MCLGSKLKHIFDSKSITHAHTLCFLKVVQDVRKIIRVFMNICLRGDKFLINRHCELTNQKIYFTYMHL